MSIFRVYAPKPPRATLWLPSIKAVPVCIAVVFCGCASVKTTTLTIADMQEATGEIQSKLEQALFIAERTADSPRWTIKVDRVLNLSTDQLSPGDRGILMRGILNEHLRSLFRDKNIRFATSMDRSQSEGIEAGTGTLASPTHALTGTLRSAGPRAGAEGRVDYYQMRYELRSLSDREVVWGGNFEFKRYAPGIVFD